MECRYSGLRYSDFDSIKDIHNISKLTDMVVSLLPLESTNKTVDEKKCEKDVRVSVKADRDYNITIEVNIRAKKYQNIIDRNIYYMHKDSGHILKEGMDYDDIPYTILINFNNFFINLFGPHLDNNNFKK